MPSRGGPEDRDPTGQRSQERSARLVAVSGCSGGGKSTLLATMARRDYTTMPEPDREVVREQLATGGDGRVPFERSIVGAVSAQAL